MTGAMRLMLREVFEAGWEAHAYQLPAGCDGDHATCDEEFTRWLAIHDLIGES